MKHQSKTEKPHSIVATGACRIVAAKTEEGKPAKLPRIEIEAYNGGVMNVGYWGPVVIDLAGLKAGSAVPILFAHDSRDVENILGQTDEVKNDGKTLTASGDMMAGSDTAKNVQTLASNGFKFQASVGIDPLVYADVEAGAGVSVNGQTLQGPFTLVSQGTLNEISIVPLGADVNTSARIAAEHGASAPSKGDTNMKVDANGKPIEGQDGQPTADQIRAAAVAEQARIGKVREVAKDHPEIMATAIENGHSPEQVERDVLKAELAAEKKRNVRPTPAIKIAGLNAEAVTPEILAAAVSMRAGLREPEKAYGAEVCAKASDLKIHSFTDLVRMVCALAGKPLEHTRHQTREFLQAAFSTRDISNVLAATANKFILEGYGTVETTWRLVSSIRPVVDFKANTGVRLTMSSLLQALAPAGEIQHGTLGDATRSVTADTKALMLAVTRKDIINDDLGVLTDIPRRLGYAAARTFNTDFWAAFSAAVSANFSASAPKSNQTTGALTSATLKAAEALYLAQTDADGNPIGGELSTLLCGTTAYNPARELYASVYTEGNTSKTPSANIYVNMFKPAFSRYLAAAPWYLVSNPLVMPLMEAAFLNGREEPFIETADCDFNTLGIQMRCYYDYGVAFAEYRAAVRSTGV